MFKLIQILLSILRNRFRSCGSLEAENAALRQQLGMLRQKTRKRIKPCFWDRLILVWLYRFCPAVLNVIQVVRPETVVRWHRQGFRSYWRRKSRARVGRPRIDPEIQSLITRISKDNPLWGAPRIHSELQMLGFDVCQTTVAKYMVKDPKKRGGQSWKAFLQNYRGGVGSMDFFIVPTIGFKLLYCLVILDHARRRIVHFAVTTTPNATWVSRQITEAFPWEAAPTYLIHDRDPVFKGEAPKRLTAMGIRDRPTAPRSPWQNGYVERLIGSIRRECMDHMIIFDADHLRRIMKSYVDYYNKVRPHLSLQKDAPIHRAIQWCGEICTIHHLGGLHHQYVRI